MPEYTQEQIDKMIADAKVEATRGLYTEDELNRKITSEVDRRVESGIQKGVETQRAKWEEEFNRKARLTAEELAQEKMNEQLKSINEREKEIQKKSNLIDARDMLSNADIPKAQYEKFMNVLVSDNAESTKTNVTNFISMFNDTKKEIEQQIKSDITNITPPNVGSKNKVVTKEDFSKLTFSEKIKFKTENPEKYKEFMR